LDRQAQRFIAAFHRSSACAFVSSQAGGGSASGCLQSTHRLPTHHKQATISRPNNDPNNHPKEHTMNTTSITSTSNSNSAPQASRSAHIASFGMAAMLTVAMLFGADLMATTDVSPNGFLQVMAQAHSARA
jgi:hypothetical protein